MVMFRNLNLGALGFRVPFSEAVELAKVGDFQGVDIDVLEMKEIIKTKSVEEVEGVVKERGLKLGGWGLPVNFRGDKEVYKRDLKMLPNLAEVASELGCRRAFTWIAPFSDEMPFEENFKLHVERLRPVAEILEDHHCLFGLEFVAPKTLRANHKYEFIHTMDGILRLCEAVGTRNLGLLLDCWHWYTSHGTLDQLRRLRGDQVIYVHVNDAPLGIPVDEQIDNIRCLPGETGVIDIIGFLRTLKKIGYDGPVTPEPFEKKLKEMPVKETVKKVGEALGRVWRKIGSKE